MGQLKPENEIKKKCLDRLRQWQSWGVVIDVDDVSDLGKRQHRGRWTMKTEKGKRDIIAIFMVKNIAWVYLIEVKAKGGVWAKEQQDYARKFAWADNVVYQVVNDPLRIDKTLEEKTGRTDLLLKEAGEFIHKPITVQIPGVGLCQYTGD